ncbi:tyrosine-type recombinase/integrase [Candidatus Microgenomates bacterium]|nr:tyrosine-type recombinase/integrase [Candidatus Microgenomates bacterium]
MADTIPSPDLNTLISDFIANLTDQKKSSATIIAYRKDLFQLEAFLTRTGKTNSTDITNLDLEGFLRELGEQHYTAKSQARKLNAIKGFFRWMRQKSLIATDPAFSVPHPKYELSQPRVLSVLEYRALRDTARSDLRIAAIVEILLQTGIRISELASLTLDDISERNITVGTRTIPLNEPAKRAIDDYLKIRQKTDSRHLFITKTGRPLLVRNIRAAIERCFAEAGIEKATVNDLRNTFIVHQLSRGVDLVTVSRIVGHKRLATTERYLSLVKDRKGTRGNGLSEL